MIAEDQTFFSDKSVCEAAHKLVFIIKRLFQSVAAVIIVVPYEIDDKGLHFKCKYL